MKEYENYRNEAIKDHSQFTEDELEDYDVSFPLGYGKDNPDTFIVETETLRSDGKKSISLKEAFEEEDWNGIYTNISISRWG